MIGCRGHRRHAARSHEESGNRPGACVALGSPSDLRIQLRVFVKRNLRKYGHAPDRQAMATETVLEQAALLSAEWATA